jgi:hypothetical protein
MKKRICTSYCQLLPPLDHGHFILFINGTRSNAHSSAERDVRSC